MRPLAILAAALLAGCAATAADCGPDWRSVGERDGRIGAGMQHERYAARCNTTVDVPAYAEGYRQGFSLRPPPMGLRPRIQDAFFRSSAWRATAAAVASAPPATCTVGNANLMPFSSKAFLIIA